jgi:ABC-type amino acid transport substrate-binding protein
MNNLMLTLLGACAVGGLLTVRWGKVLRHAVLIIALLATTIVGARLFFTSALHNEYSKDKIIASMQLLRSADPAIIHRWPPPPRPSSNPQPTRFEQIRTRGILRVGYVPDNLPWTYFNAADQFVGLNVEMAHALAREMNVGLEFVPIDRNTMGKQLDTGYCDIVMAAVAMTPERARVMAFSASYMDQTLAFIVKDHRRKEFNSREANQRLKAPRIGVPNVRYYIDKVRQYLPHATLIVLNSITEFFETHGEDLDAFVFTAESGSAWSLLYPAYTVAIPQPDILAVPLAYALPRGDLELVNFINIWIELKKKDKTIASLYDYWILGKNAVPKPPRWSVLRNVLGIGTDQDKSLTDKGDPWM